MQAQLDNYRQQIDAAIRDYFNSHEAQAGLELQGHELEALKLLEEFSFRPGKRLRGALALFAYEHFNKTSNPPAIKAGVALELVQNYFLIIDDVMDRSNTRRGQPAIHKILQKSLGGGQEHAANMLAVSVGLLAMHMAGRLLADVQEDPANLNQANKILQKNILATIYGQVDDLYNDLTGQATEADILRLMRLKTSYYTFVSPLQLGAALAGVKDAQTYKEIEAISLPAGLAFQLQDDLLGLFGQEQDTGKSATDDLKEGKLTLLMLYTFERASSLDVAKVRRVLGNSTLTDEAYQEVKSIAERCGAKQAVEDKARDYCREAQAAITAAKHFDAPAKKFLSSLVDYVVERKV